MNDFEEKWKKSQIAGWINDKEEVVLFFKRFGIEFDDIYNRILLLKYEQLRTVCFLLSKIRKIIDICDFLDQKAKLCKWDVDVMKIYLLISHAEIAMRDFGGRDENKKLVENFFNPVVKESKLNYKIRLSLGGFPMDNKRSLIGTQILYKMRCEYVHEGNYTGKIFRSEYDEDFSFNIFTFKCDRLEILCGECNFTYEQFLVVYIRALMENIKLYIKK